MSCTVRDAGPDDVPAIHALITELAVYEQEPDAVEGTVEDLHDALFASAPQVSCHVATIANTTGANQVVGIAIWFTTFSTWKVRHGIWLEDLYVTPAARGRGVGRSLIRHLAGICVQRGYARLEWSVLNWNQPAIEVYRHLRAIPQDEWTTYRLTGAALQGVAAEEPATGSAR